MRHSSLGTFLRGVLAIFIALAAMTMLALSATPASAGDGNPAVTVEIVAPAQVVYGHRAFTMKVRLTNVTEEIIAFDGSVEHGGLGWSGEDLLPAISTGTNWGGRRCQVFGASLCLAYRWWGSIPAGKTVEFVLPTFSGYELGTYEFAYVSFALSNGQSVGGVKSITLVTDPKAADVPITVTTSPSGREWPRGESRQVVITVRHSTLTQFRITKILSKGGCEIAGLYLQNGQPNRTEQSFVYYLQMPATATVGVDCAIVMQVTTSDGRIGYQNATFEVT